MPLIRRIFPVLLFCVLWLSAIEARAGAFLFDATKAETAGNADWVLDADNNVSGRFPTPAAAGITASTPETYWTGALSSWGVALVKLGHTVETLPVGGRITYQDSTNVQDLSNYRVFVVCEPNILFTTAEKTAIVRYVQNGGGLFIISDHYGSDRNNDGADSVAIWNDLFTNNGVQANPFGVAINNNSLSLTSTFPDTATDNPLTNGPQGAVTQLKYSAGATMTLSTASNPSVRAAFWTTSAHTASTVMAAYGTFGLGRFAVIGDSSPSDDGTGATSDTLYDGWTDLSGNHSRFYLNASVWLQASPPANDTLKNAAQLTGNAASGSGSNVYATKETGEPNHAGNAGGHSLWWTWTAPANGYVTVSTAGSNFDTILGIYTGTSINALTTIASDDNSGGSLTSKTTFAATAGVIYFMAVDGFGGATGSVALNLTNQTYPSVSIAASVAPAMEKGNVAGTFRLTLNAAPLVQTAVKVQLAGTAAPNVDYSASPAAASDGTVIVTFPAGQTSATLTITPVDDNDPTEGDESVSAAVLSDGGYTVNAASATAGLTIQDHSSYTSAWAATYRSMGFSGANAMLMADPDADGVPNLLEFAFNLNPLAPDAAGLPSVGMAMFADPSDGTGALRRFLTVTLARRTDAPNLTYAVEACDDLATGNWTTAGAVLVSASATGMPAGTERAVYRTVRPLDGPNAAARQYLHVRVSATP